MIKLQHCQQQVHVIDLTELEKMGHNGRAPLPHKDKLKLTRM